MKFIGSNRFCPVAQGKDVPQTNDLFHYSSDLIPKAKKEKTEWIKDNNIIIDKAWWQKQYYRCMNGFTVPEAIDMGGDMFVDGEDILWKGNDAYMPEYNILYKDRAVHISNRYYFYLNFWTILGVKNINNGLAIKEEMRPLFIDMQYMFHERIRLMYKLNKDDQELKARQKGFSEMTAGSLIGYNYTFLIPSINVIVAGEGVDAEHTFENSKRGLDALANTQFYRKHIVNNSDERRSSKRSRIICLTANNNPQAVSRFSPTLVLYEEVGKGAKDWSIETANFVQPSIYAQNGIKTGWQVWIGTGGDMKDGVADLEKRFHDPDDYNILKFKNKWSKLSIDQEAKVGQCTLAYWMKVIDENGNTLKQQGIDLINDEASKKKKEEQYRHKTQQPLCVEDIFMSSDAGFYGKTVIEALNNRYYSIINRKELQIERKGRLIFNNPLKPFEGVKFVQDPNGWLTIVEEPVVDVNDKLKYVNLYKAATDSYDIDESKTSFSKGAMCVKKEYHPLEATYKMYVAEIFERPTVEDGGAETFYLHTAMTCIYYGCLNNIEYSNKRIFDWYINNGFECLLRPRPRLAFANTHKSTMTNKYGTDPNLKPEILAISKDGLTEDSIDRMFLTGQIKALSKFIYDTRGKYNCDRTIAFALCEVSCKEEQMYVVKTKEELQHKEIYKSYVSKNGILQLVYN